MKRLFFVILLCVVSKYLHAQIEDFEAINFTKADKIAEIYEVKKLNNLPKLAYDLTHNLHTPVEKFRAIYTWVSLNLDSDYYYQEKVIKTRKKLINDSLAFKTWSQKNRQVFFKKLINQQKTVCTGYAYLIKELANLVNIECEIIDGYGRNADLIADKLEIPNHSWNAVKLNNKWYLCDATWSSGYTFITREKTQFIHKYNDGYFLADPELFFKSHFPENKKWTLLANPTLEETFLNAPYVYDETFIHKVLPLEPQKLVTTVQKDQFLQFKFKTVKKIDSKNITLEIAKGNSKYTATPIFIKTTEENVLAFKHQFKGKGLCDVHVKIGKDIVATFTIKLKKRVKEPSS